MPEREVPLLTRRQTFGFLAGAGLAVAVPGLASCGSTNETHRSPEVPTPYWPIRSVDTMKQSRDESLVILSAFKHPLSRQQMLGTIDREIENIANLHTTHVAIGTPYDEPFLPVAEAYINSARKHGLNIWWRGNFCAYDFQDSTKPQLGGWFGYQHNPNSLEQPHKIAQFIQQHGDLLQRGDIFMPWPEPENVVNFYQRTNDYNNLLLAEYTACQPLRSRGVLAGNCSMNGDVAVDLDPKLVNRLGNVVMIDHYVPEVPLMGKKIRSLHSRYPGAQVIVGEFGMSDPAKQQAKFVSGLFDQMKLAGVTGMNYWVDIGGGTQLENTLTNFRPVYYIVQKNYGASAKAKH